MANSDAKTNKPVKTMRLRGISASIFANPAKTNGNDSTFWKVSIQRSYKDSDGEFQTTSSFSRDDLPIVWLLSQKAWEFVLKEEATTKD